MNLSTILRSAVVLAVLALSACSNPIGVYRGSTTSTTTGPGGSATRTVTGDLATIFASADPNSVVIEASGLAFTATKNGDSLTFPGGQAQSVTETTGSSNTSLTSGTGTLTSTSLTMNLTLTFSQTQNGQTGNGTIMATFTGQKI
jgi:hypothetical protein